MFHVASPFPNQAPKDEQELIKPALEGTLNVLNAAFDAGVGKVVVTSSVIAVSGMCRDDREFDENDWPQMEGLTAYAKSKVLAERAAWDFVAEKKKNGEKCFELAVINPSFILGPSLHLTPTAIGTSEKRILDILTGTTKKIPYWYVGVCDVRDVALAHLRAAFLSEASGYRHIIMTQKKFYSMKDLADVLREEFIPKGFDICKEDETGPDNNTRVANNRMINILGINPISLSKTLVDMANSFIEAGMAQAN